MSKAKHEFTEEEMHELQILFMKIHNCCDDMVYEVLNAYKITEKGEISAFQYQVIMTIFASMLTFVYHSLYYVCHNKMEDIFKIVTTTFNAFKKKMEFGQHEDDTPNYLN